MIFPLVSAFDFGFHGFGETGFPPFAPRAAGPHPFPVRQREALSTGNGCLLAGGVA